MIEILRKRRNNERNSNRPTTIARSSLAELRSLQKKALILYENYCAGVDIGQKLKDLSDYYMDNNISSGGVADIFILTKTFTT